MTVVVEIGGTDSAGVSELQGPMLDTATVRLLHAMLPTAQNPVRAANNRFYFAERYENAGIAGLAGTTSFVTTVPEGAYTAEDLCAALQAAIPAARAFGSVMAPEAANVLAPAGSYDVVWSEQAGRVGIRSRTEDGPVLVVHGPCAAVRLLHAAFSPGPVAGFVQLALSLDHRGGHNLGPGSVVHVALERVATGRVATLHNCQVVVGGGVVVVWVSQAAVDAQLGGDVVGPYTGTVHPEAAERNLAGLLGFHETVQMGSPPNAVATMAPVFSPAAHTHTMVTTDPHVAVVGDTLLLGPGNHAATVVEVLGDKIVTVDCPTLVAGATGAVLVGTGGRGRACVGSGKLDLTLGNRAVFVEVALDGEVVGHIYSNRPLLRGRRFLARLPLASNPNTLFLDRETTATLNAADLRHVGKFRRVAVTLVAEEGGAYDARGASWSCVLAFDGAHF